MPNIGKTLTKDGANIKCSAVIQADYTIHDQKLQVVKEAKYLGVTLDSKLSFNAHINNIAKKANNTRAFVHRNTKDCPRRVKSTTYNTLVRPQLEYCSAVWSPHTLNNKQQLQAVQRRAARSVMNDWSTRRHTDPPVPKGSTKGSPTAMQQFLKWDTLEERRAKSRVIMFYKIVHQLVDIPVYLLIPNLRSTRSHKQMYHVLAHTVKAYQYSFFPSSILLWNSLPPTLVEAPSVDALKARLSSARLVPNAEY